MFCPQCRAEYRPGFTHCSDCDVDLVYELPSESTRQSNSREGTWDGKIIQEGEELRVVWEGDNSTDCVDVCNNLRDAGIEYRVNQSVAGRGRGMSVDFHYQLAVGADDYEVARKALGYSEENDTEWSEQEVENGLAELSTRDDRPVEEIHGDWSPKGLHPEDATVEIWRGNPQGGESTVEMSLRENRINYRVEQRGAEPKRVFVLPEDEAKAREIVREILEGVPPE